jgi:mycothiol synthase
VTVSERRSTRGINRQYMDMDAMTLPDGYAMRAPLLEEAGAVADLMNAVELILVGENQTTTADVHRFWTVPDRVIERDLRVLTDRSEAIVGYMEYEGIAPWTELQLDGYVHPDQVGRGLGSALLDWGEARARADALRAVPGEPVVVRHFLWFTDEVGRALLERRGFTVCRHLFTMIIDLTDDLPDAVWPEGIQVRSMRSGEERRVWEADSDGFRDHWGFQQEPFEDWRHWHVEKEGFDPDLVLLAMDGDEIAGTALCYPSRTEDPKKGWVQFLSVRQPWRRRGLATALLRHAFVLLRDRGCERAGLGVDATNPHGAVALYEKAGMRQERTAVSYEKALR